MGLEDRAAKHKQTDQEPWGYDMHLTLRECNPVTPELAASFAPEICKVIGMKTFGDPITNEYVHPRIGDLMRQVQQLIETSNISTIYEANRKIVMIQIFSCKTFDEEVALEFSQGYFGGTLGEHDFIIRA